MVEGVVAITGGTGFVGQHLIERLAAEPCTVRLLTRAGADRGGPASRPDVETVRGDLDDLSALRRLTEGADAVIHLAGKIGARDRAEFEAVNVDGTRRVAAAAQAAKAGRFIFVSSLAAREPHLSDYAASKNRAERELVRLAGRGEPPWVIVRPPAVYGPGDKATLPLMQSLTHRLALVPGRAEARFSLIYVEDLAEAIVTLIGNEDAVGQTIELDDGAPGGYDWRSLAKIAGEVCGRRVRPIHLPRTMLSATAGAVELGARVVDRTPTLTRGKVRELYHVDWVCENTGLQTNGVWSPKTRFSEGFRKTVDWYRSEGWL